jgi:hypothetical protein
MADVAHLLGAASQRGGLQGCQGALLLQQRRLLRREVLLRLVQRRQVVCRAAGAHRASVPRAGVKAQAWRQAARRPCMISTIRSFMMYTSHLHCST